MSEVTPAEVKAALDRLNAAWAEFKTTNDANLSQRDVVWEGKLATLNKTMSDAQAVVTQAQAEAKAAKDRCDELELRLNRQRLAGGAESEGAELKHVAEFNLVRRLRLQSKGRGVPEDFGVDEYRAYKQAFQNWLRRGPDHITDEERKTMFVGSDPDGGFFVTPDVTGRIVQKIYETSDVRQVASVQTISTDALEGVIDNDEAAAGWTSEQGSRTASETPEIGKYRIPVHEMYAMPEATQTLLDDAAIDVEGWLAAKVSEYMIRLENTAFVSGTGVGRPRGFTSYTTVATADASRSWGQLEHLATGSAGGFGSAPNGSDKLIELVHKLKTAYRTGARFAMSRTTLGATRQLKANSEYIWLPSMDAAQPSRLLGFPVSEWEDLDDYSTTDALAIVFGNFAVGYQIVDRQGFRTLRDPFTNKPYVRFYTTRRVGGDVVNYEAIKFLKFGTS